MFFFTAYYLSNHNMQSFMALKCSLTMTDVLAQFDQKLPTESIFCAEWCCDTPSYNGEISPTRPSYNGDISPTSHASLTSQCLPLQLVHKIEASSQIESKRQSMQLLQAWLDLITQSITFCCMHMLGNPSYHSEFYSLKKYAVLRFHVIEPSICRNPIFNLVTWSI